MTNKTITTKRRCYWRTDVIETPGNRILGRLVSTPQGFRLHTTDSSLRWFRARLFKTPAHLLTAYQTTQGN